MVRERSKRLSKRGKMSQSTECPICFDPVDVLKVFPCGGGAKHLFCVICTQRLFTKAKGRQAECPMCRKVVTVPAGVTCVTDWVVSLPENVLSCDSCGSLKPIDDNWFCFDCVQIICSRCYIQDGHGSHRTAVYSDAEVPGLCLAYLKDADEVWTETDQQNRQRLRAFFDQVIDLMMTEVSQHSPNAILAHKFQQEYGEASVPMRLSRVNADRMPNVVAKLARLTGEQVDVDKIGKGLLQPDGSPHLFKDISSKVWQSMKFAEFPGKRNLAQMEADQPSVKRAKQLSPMPVGCLVAVAERMSGAQIWTPSTDDWTREDLFQWGVVPRGSALCSLDGFLYQLGGIGQKFTVNVLDPQYGTWSDAPSLSVERTFHCAAVLKEKLFVLGGFLSRVDRTAEFFDLRKREWRRLTEKTASPRMSSSLVAFQEKLFVLGGFKAGTSVETWDPEAQIWTPDAPMNHARRKKSAAGVLNGCVYVLGGEEQMELSSMERFDPRAGVWEELAGPRAIRGQTSAQIWRDKILALGRDEENQPTAELFDPLAAVWSPAPHPDIRSTGYFNLATLL